MLIQEHRDDTPSSTKIRARFSGKSIHSTNFAIMARRAQKWGGGGGGDSTERLQKLTAHQIENIQPRRVCNHPRSHPVSWRMPERGGTLNATYDSISRVNRTGALYIPGERKNNGRSVSEVDFCSYFPGLFWQENGNSDTHLSLSSL